MMKRPVIIVALMALLANGVASAQSGLANTQPAATTNVGFEQRLGEQISLNQTFRDEGGREVRLQDFFNGKPVILIPVYYECPMLCSLVLNGLTDALTQLRFNAGNEFNVVAVSFDPRETPNLAAAKKAIYLRHYGRHGTEQGWHFLTGEEKQIKQLMEAIGFRYAFDRQTNQFAHASGIVVLTPQGRIARYFYGIEFPVRDLRLGLVEAADRRIGSPVDAVLLLCYQYDPATGRYTALALNFLRLSGALTLIALASFIIWMLRRDRRRTSLAITD